EQDLLRVAVIERFEIGHGAGQRPRHRRRAARAHQAGVVDDVRPVTSGDVQVGVNGRVAGRAPGPEEHQAVAQVRVRGHDAVDRRLELFPLRAPGGAAGLAISAEVHSLRPAHDDEDVRRPDVGHVADPRTRPGPAGPRATAARAEAAAGAEPAAAAEASAGTRAGSGAEAARARTGPDAGRTAGTEAPAAAR